MTTDPIIGLPPSPSQPPADLMARLLYWDRELAKRHGLLEGKSDWAAAHDKILELARRVQYLEAQPLGGMLPSPTLPWGPLVPGTWQPDLAPPRSDFPITD